MDQIELTLADVGDKALRSYGGRTLCLWPVATACITIFSVSDCTRYALKRGAEWKLDGIFLMIGVYTIINSRSCQTD
jgi:hypothetical protein